MVTPMAKSAEKTGIEGGNWVYPKMANISKRPPIISNPENPKKGIDFVFFFAMEYTINEIVNIIYKGERM